MEILKMMAARQPDEFTTCPNCGGCDYESNRIDEAPFREAASEWQFLRHLGRDDEAIEVRAVFHAVRIINEMRLEWRCMACGVAFDG